MGALTNIDQEGFASVAFHSFPSTLKWDGYSGDYGPNFFGHAFNTATYIVNHPDFGWLAFGGNVKVEGDWVKVQPLDSLRMRVYIAPRGLWLTLDAGTFESVQVNTRTNQIRIALSPQTADTSQARLHIEQPVKLPGIGTYHPQPQLIRERDAYVAKLKPTATWITLIAE